VRCVRRYRSPNRESPKAMRSALPLANGEPPEAMYRVQTVVPSSSFGARSPEGVRSRVPPKKTTTVGTTTTCARGAGLPGRRAEATARVPPAPPRNCRHKFGDEYSKALVKLATRYRLPSSVATDVAPEADQLLEHLSRWLRNRAPSSERVRALLKRIERLRLEVKDLPLPTRNRADASSGPVWGSKARGSRRRNRPNSTAQ